MADSLVSLFIPCFNEEEFLPQFLESLSNQSLSRFSAYFLDNASTDSSFEILNNYRKVDSRISVIRYDNHGSRTLQGSRIRYFAHRAPFVAMRSVNDHIHPEFLRQTVGLLIDCPDVGLAYSHGDLLDLDTGERMAVNESQKIDTRDKSITDGFFHVVSRYTQSFSLWGVYRRQVFDSLFPIYCYGADHVLVAEASLYGRIAATTGNYSTMTMRSSESALDSIRRMWQSHHPLSDRGVSVDSKFMSSDIRLPFTSMIKGHLVMVAGAKVSEELKPTLQHIAFETLRQRFKPVIDFEHNNFISFFSDLDIHEFFKTNLLGLSSFTDSLISIRSISPQLSDYCDELLRKVLPLRV